MKINIVTEPPGHIIPKMMAWIQKDLGWTLSVYKANPKADFNYYASYLNLGQANPVNTKKVGWFTHYEKGSTWKENIWNEYSEKVDLRLSCVDRYVSLLKKSGKSAKIIPGIDRNFFEPKANGAGTRRVGTSGLAQPRKGEGLILKLAQEKLRIELIVTGQGWKLPHTWLPDAQMPNFYSILDVYLCTSLIEGIPVPPLEALACGTKVVVPKGVGILDELPETSGVRHYKKGVYKDMIRAINLALTDKVDAATLRSLTEKYSIKNWVESHDKAFRIAFRNYSR